MHIFLHFLVPIAVAVAFYRPQWRSAALLLLATLAVDVDHLLATPIYDPNRCSIGFHPLHTPAPTLFYAVLLIVPLLYWANRGGVWSSTARSLHLIGLGLIIHMLLDGLDCLERDTRSAISQPDAAWTEPWQLEGSVTGLRAASCQAGTDTAPATPVLLDVEAVSVSTDDASMPEATLLAAWHLRSEHRDFGGLSGLAVSGENELLAVSDQGAFFWLALDDAKPVAARYATMRGADGEALPDKRRRDAEGLALHDGLALVSFEREHRVMAFDLAGCGAGARGVTTAQFGPRIEGLSRPLKDNGGVEGLALTPESQLLLALETDDAGLPLALAGSPAGARVLGRIATRGAPVLTGLEAAGGLLYALLRSYTPGIGNIIEVVRFRLPMAAGLNEPAPEISVQRVLKLEPRHGTDNFEGIALQQRADGRRFLYLISDDNFSARQRTLLYVLELHDMAIDEGLSDG